MMILRSSFVELQLISVNSKKPQFNFSKALLFYRYYSNKRTQDYKGITAVIKSGNDISINKEYKVVFRLRQHPTLNGRFAELLIWLHFYNFFRINIQKLKKKTKSAFILIRIPPIFAKTSVSLYFHPKNLLDYLNLGSKGS